jgi:hypothetical protein
MAGGTVSATGTRGNGAWTGCKPIRQSGKSESVPGAKKIGRSPDLPPRAARYRGDLNFTGTERPSDMPTKTTFQLITAAVLTGLIAAVFLAAMAGALHPAVASTANVSTLVAGKVALGDRLE